MGHRKREARLREVVNLVYYGFMRQTHEYGDTGEALVSLATNLVFLSEEIALGGGVTAVQWAVLHHVGSAGPDGLSPSAIAEAIRTTRPNVTKIIARLQRGGYIDATASAADGRRKNVRLTRSGARVLDAMNAEKARRVGMAMAALTDTERRAFWDIAQWLLESLQTARVRRSSIGAGRRPSRRGFVERR